jgi:hypothetical protein
MATLLAASALRVSSALLLPPGFSLLGWRRRI